MEAISAFDMLKIGVGPSSSHTLGPWRAVQRWLTTLPLGEVSRIEIRLYGSLALTGKGHYTDKAVCLALLGHDPRTIDTATIPDVLDHLAAQQILALADGHTIPFNPATDVVFLRNEQLPYHPNGMTCVAWIGEAPRATTYYSVGGGFVVEEGFEQGSAPTVALTYPCETSADILRHCTENGLSIAQMVRTNETAWRTPRQIETEVLAIWDVMRACIYKGCHTTGTLPGGLRVKRRAADLSQALLYGATYTDIDAWIAHIRARTYKFNEVLRWVSCFALAVNEENAGMGRVVTAPTNGAAGVIPAVLLYRICFAEEPVRPRQLVDFLLVAGELGALFKKKATISAALGGCQAEIGVSSAMAAAALTEMRGGTVEQALMAAEIAMEHHLGMTCDPVGGLVQIPCIERNAMGAVKAISAAELALESNPKDARVTLDDVIRTMWETAQDMNTKYKETSQGGLSIVIPVGVPEC